MKNNLDFTCTFEDRQLDRVLFDRLHENVNRCHATNNNWTYYPTVVECNKVIVCCLDRMEELTVSNFEYSIKANKMRLCREVARCFSKIQQRLFMS